MPESTSGALLDIYNFVKDLYIARYGQAAWECFTEKQECDTLVKTIRMGIIQLAKGPYKP